jgi:hypothetical protein
MTRDSDDHHELLELARRHLKACELIYDTALQRNDADVAAHSARSALSVALNCTIGLSEETKRETVMSWFERLSTLYETTPSSSYLSRAIRWATDATDHIFPGEERDSHPRVGESE